MEEEIQNTNKEPSIPLDLTVDELRCLRSALAIVIALTLTRHGASAQTMPGYRHVFQITTKVAAALRDRDTKVIDKIVTEESGVLSDPDQIAKFFGF
jgi:hypothetical protein